MEEEYYRGTRQRLKLSGASPHTLGFPKREEAHRTGSLMTSHRNMSVAMPSPGISAIMAEFQLSSRPLVTFAVSIYILGLALGPMSVLHFIWAKHLCTHSRTQGSRTIVRDIWTSTTLHVDEYRVCMLHRCRQFLPKFPFASCSPIPPRMCRLSAFSYWGRYHHRPVPAGDESSGH